MFLQDTHDFIQAIDELLPLARAGLEGCLIPVRSAFVDSIGIAVKNFNLHCVTVRFILFQVNICKII